MAEVDPGYAGSRAAVQQRLTALPGQFDADVQGLEAQQQRAFGGITDAARRRGMGFSGIPLAEQAQYTSSEFLPAVAKLKGQQENTRLSLVDMLSQLDREQRGTAMGIRQGELDREQQQSQFEQQQRAARAAMASPTLRPPTTPGNQAAATPAAVGKYGFKNGQDGSGGFWFTDHVGNTVSADQYARINNIPLATLLSSMAQSGDTYARSALNSKPAPARDWDFSKQFPLLYGNSKQLSSVGGGIAGAAAR